MSRRRPRAATLSRGIAGALLLGAGVALGPLPARAELPPSSSALPATAAQGPAAGAVTSAPPADAEQEITIYLRDLPAGHRAFVQCGDDPAVAMTDPGVGVLRAELRGPPRSALPLRLWSEAPDGRVTTLYAHTVLLADARWEVIGLRYDLGRAVRLPVAPSARLELATDPRVSWWVGFGWGALALVYVMAMVGLSTRVRR